MNTVWSPHIRKGGEMQSQKIQKGGLFGVKFKTGAQTCQTKPVLKSRIVTWNAQSVLTKLLAYVTLSQIRN